MTNTVNLNLIGWVHVHTWHESHDNYDDHIYQKEPDAARTWERQVELLHVIVYRDSAYGSAERATGVRHESGKFAHDYLLAREIRGTPELYERFQDSQVSPCYTAGADDFVHKESGRLYRITSVAGHGEWAFEIQEGDLMIKEW